MHFLHQILGRLEKKKNLISTVDASHLSITLMIISRFVPSYVLLTIVSLLVEDVISELSNDK